MEVQNNFIFNMNISFYFTNIHINIIQNENKYLNISGNFIAPFFHVTSIMWWVRKGYRSTIHMCNSIWMSWCDWFTLSSTSCKSSHSAFAITGPSFAAILMISGPVKARIILLKILYQWSTSSLGMEQRVYSISFSFLLRKLLLRFYFDFIVIYLFVRIFSCICW